MTLVDTQRSFLEVCFRREPPPEALANLGGEEHRWLLYRHMVRTRMRNMLASALKRTAAALGDEAWGRWYDRWLDEAPPRTRYVREITAEFVEFALPLWRGDPSVPPWVGELATVEATRWELGYLDVPMPTADEVAFEKIPVVSPLVRLLHVDHAVHRRRAEDDAPPERAPTHLCVYRRADDRTGVWALDDFAAALLEAFTRGDQDITTCVKNVATAQAIPVDEALVQRLGTLLAEFVQRSILLGTK